MKLTRKIPLGLGALLVLSLIVIPFTPSHAQVLFDLSGLGIGACEQSNLTNTATTNAANGLASAAFTGITDGCVVLIAGTFTGVASTPFQISNANGTTAKVTFTENALLDTIRLTGARISVASSNTDISGTTIEFTRGFASTKGAGNSPIDNKLSGSWDGHRVSGGDRKVQVVATVSSPSAQSTPAAVATVPNRRIASGIDAFSSASITVSGSPTATLTGVITLGPGGTQSVDSRHDLALLNHSVEFTSPGGSTGDVPGICSVASPNIGSIVRSSDTVVAGAIAPNDLICIKLPEPIQTFNEDGTEGPVITFDLKLGPAAIGILTPAPKGKKK